MNRLFARFLVFVFMGFFALVARADAPAPQREPAWLESLTPCAQCP